MAPHSRATGWPLPPRNEFKGGENRCRHVTPLGQKKEHPKKRYDTTCRGEGKLDGQITVPKRFGLGGVKERESDSLVGFFATSFTQLSY